VTAGSLRSYKPRFALLPPPSRTSPLTSPSPLPPQELTYIIKQDISDLNSQIASLQHLTKASSANPPSKKAGTSKQVEEHNSNVVMLLQSKLANMGMGFKDVLEIRTQVSWLL